MELIFVQKAPALITLIFGCILSIGAGTFVYKIWNKIAGLIIYCFFVQFLIEIYMLFH